ncbi:MAG: hypothetical protein WBQ18_05400 [Solirubrobacteraceae bacterium]
MAGGGHDPALICPACHARFAGTERFCPACRLPLVLDAQDTRRASDRHDRARKVKPQLTEGRLVRVAGARNQTEGEFIQGLLLEEGVPSMLRRSAGFDVPDFLAAGPRDVMVPLSGAQTAREVLLGAELVSGTDGPSGAVSARALATGLLAALAVGALIVWLATLLLH